MVPLRCYSVVRKDFTGPTVDCDLEISKIGVGLGIIYSPGEPTIWRSTEGHAREDGACLTHKVAAAVLVGDLDDPRAIKKVIWDDPLG